MSNDEVRWTRRHIVENSEVEENIHNFKIRKSNCDNCLVNSSDSCKEYVENDSWTAAPAAKRKGKRRVLSTTAIKSCHRRPLFSATTILNKFLSFKLVTFILIFNFYLDFLTCRTASAAAVIDSSNDFSKGGHYTHTWAVHIPNGEEDGRADQVATDHGFINLGKIFDDHYHFAHHKVQKRSLDPSHHHQSKLENDHRIQWAAQQKAKSRQKRDYIRRPSRNLSPRRTLMDTLNLIDPKWGLMWYLNRGGGLDMNVIPAWQQGITGKGVVVTILDDGLEYDHPDIEHNYDPKASFDVNNNDSDPSPQYDMTDSNRHGTRCAGEVAATANNTFCAVGIAYDAKVGGVRMLDGDVTDAVEAKSLSLNPQHIDIYSASWGPDDDGKTVDGPGDLATRAFIEGVTKGRNGKGSIFIWASGNGGRELDNCNCDGYTNSIWTLSISSATEDGNVPWYSEKCSSTLATTYSSGAQHEKQVVTTDLHHTCTVSHTGTSASAPLAAGIAALVLEANRNLTWRDLQHIVVRTSQPANLQDSTWSKNGVGRNVSHSFGYGLMDAAAMVKLARIWKTVPEQQKCEIHAPHVDTKIPPKSYITLQLTVKHCMSVNFLEHVQAKITLTSQRRGDLQINLISPAGTKVTLLTHRIHDISRSGFNQWPFMSVHTWGEAPHGNWQLEIYNDGRYMAQITQWDMIFFGTEKPAQPEDPVRISPFDDSRNTIDETSSQWRDIPDIQQSEHNAIRNDACKDFASNQRCIACSPSTFLYKGQCFTECPSQTYSPPNVYIAKEYIHQNQFRRKRESAKICLPCDKTCLTCNGSNPNECTSCFPGSQLRFTPDQGSSCHSFSERSSGNNYGAGSESGIEGPANISSAIIVLVIVPGVIIVLGVSVLVVYRNFFFGNSFSYTPVAFDSNSRDDCEGLVGNEDDDNDAEDDEEDVANESENESDN